MDVLNVVVAAVSSLDWQFVMRVPFVAEVFLLTYTLFVLYLAYLSLRLAHRNGKLAKAPRIVQAVAWSILIIAGAVDVFFNVLIGSILFYESPSRKAWTFSKRCASHRESSGYRGRLARWVCDGWLNPFDEQHC